MKKLLILISILLLLISCQGEVRQRVWQRSEDNLLYNSYCVLTIAEYKGVRIFEMFDDCVSKDRVRGIKKNQREVCELELRKFIRKMEDK